MKIDKKDLILIRDLRRMVTKRRNISYGKQEKLDPKVVDELVKEWLIITKHYQK